MPASTPRTRLIFQNANVFAGPAGSSGNTATGALYHSPVWGYANSGNNMIAELLNVTQASLSVSLNRQDLNVLGVLNRVGQIFIDPADITLDVTYNATDGYNESILGFNAWGQSFLSGILTKVSDSKNYFISVSPQGIDDDGYTNQFLRDVYGIGNGYISNYTFDASVGNVATTSFSVNAMNIAGFTGTSGSNTPAVDLITSNRITQWTFQLPVGVATGINGVYALKPGDVTLQFPTNAGFLAPLSGTNEINIQSVSLSVPIARENLQRLGSPFGYSREIQFPVNCSLAIRALATEINPTSYDQLLCNDPAYDLTMILRQPSCQGTGLNAIVIGFNEAKVTNWSQGITVGGDSTVDVQLSCQVAGSTSLEGVTFSGFGSFQV